MVSAAFAFHRQLHVKNCEADQIKTKTDNILLQEWMKVLKLNISTTFHPQNPVQKQDFDLFDSTHIFVIKLCSIF